MNNVILYVGIHHHCETYCDFITVASFNENKLKKYMENWMDREHSYGNGANYSIYELVLNHKDVPCMLPSLNPISEQYPSFKYSVFIHEIKQLYIEDRFEDIVGIELGNINNLEDYSIIIL